MKKRAVKSRSAMRELVAFDKRVVDYAKLKLDLSAVEIVKLLGPQPGIIVSPSGPIETLSPTKTLGKGRTNLTFVGPTIVQIDVATPYASFDINKQSSPTISMHFEPIAYGITSPATYIMEFAVQVFGPSTFVLGGFAGSGTLVNAGTKALNGLTTVSLVMRNVQPFAQTYCSLRQTAGVAWKFLSVQARFPDLVIKQLGG